MDKKYTRNETIAILKTPKEQSQKGYIEIGRQFTKPEQHFRDATYYIQVFYDDALPGTIIYEFAGTLLDVIKYYSFKKESVNRYSPLRKADEYEDKILDILFPIFKA